MFNLGIFASHNAAAAISYQGKVLEVVELERFINDKNAAFVFWGNHPNLKELVTELARYFKEKYKVERYHNVVHNSCTDKIIKIFPADHYEWVPHHQAHAYSALYQSPYDLNQECLIITFDGGSDEGFFNVYLGKKQEQVKKIYQGRKDYAVSYMMPAHYIADIRQENIFVGNLVYAGKIMGLAAYGKVRDEFIKPLIDFYHSNTNDNIIEAQNRFREFFKEYNLSDTNRFIGEDAKDLAATNQYVFETLFENEVKQIFAEYPNLPVILVGGCALNILNNTKIAARKELFVPPNPNDCGIAVGLVTSKIRPHGIVDCTYIGPEVWDRQDLPRYLFERKGSFLDFEELVDNLIAGEIYGIVRGRSEHGPRALGNRSIICNPTIAGMKDTLNAKVKGREYYRPFAPIVRLEDAEKFFNMTKPSKWMGYAYTVKEEYRDKLLAITHADGTARVQTVTQEQNPFIYSLLTRINNKTGIGVILNTSFNVAGKPILNTYKDAFEVLDKTQMDGLILENYIFKKNM